MRLRRWVPAAFTRRSGSSAFSVPKRAALLTIISVRPMMALSGVRSSWLMLARNCDLCSLANPNWRLLSSNLAEQACVLDRQHRLGREGLKSSDDLGGECASSRRRMTRPPSIRCSRTSGIARSERRPISGEEGPCLRCDELPLVGDVGDLDGLPDRTSPTDARPRPKRIGSACIIAKCSAVIRCEPRACKVCGTLVELVD